MAAACSVIVLAGGGATRMGGEKALRDFGGRSLLQIALDTSRAVSDDQIVACGARHFDLPATIRSAPDAPADHGKGPLAGVCAGLQLARHDAVLVLACDLPFVTPPLLHALLNALDHADCAWCRASADEPLVAALRRDAALPAVQQALAQGRNKVLPVWASLRPFVLQGPALAELGDPARLFANINTLQDLDRA